MRLEAQLVREETFTFTAPDQPDITIRSGRLREWLLANAMDKLIDLTFPSDDTLETLIARHGLEQPRMDSITLLEAQDPVVVGQTSWGTSMLIDGAHRRYFWWKRSVHTIRGWAVPEIVWRQFLFDPRAPGVIKIHDNGAMLPQRRQHGRA